MTAATPGQAAYEAWREAQGYPDDTGDRPEYSVGDLADAMNRAFLAGIAAAQPQDLAAQDAQPAPVSLEEAITAEGPDTPIGRLLRHVAGTDDEYTPQPAPVTLRADLDAAVRIWREESRPYPDEDAADSARRGGFGYCADELAQILARHPQPPAPSTATKENQ